MLVICLKLFDVSYRQIESSSFLSLLIVCLTNAMGEPRELTDPLLSWAVRQASRSHNAVGHAAADLPLHAANSLKLNELCLTWPQRKLNQVVALFVAFYREPAQLELQLLLQSVVLGEVLIEVGDTGLVFVLILVDFVGLLCLGVHSLGLLALCAAELLELLLAVEHCAHHDLTGHRESSWIHLPEHNGLLLARFDFDIVAGALLWLLDLELLELRVVDVLTVACLHLVIYNVDVAVSLLSHGEVLRDLRSALLGKIGSLTLSELLLSAASHELANKFILVVLALLVAEED